MADTTSLFKLIFWPTLITAGISTARLITEVKGMVNNQSGGGGAWLGITWCMFVFGGWFGWRLAKQGAGPRVRRAWLWSLLAFLAIAGTIMWRFRNIDIDDRSDAAFAYLRETVLLLGCIAGAGALVQFVAWPRLAMALLAYAIPARLTVLLFTWLAKENGWDTHYTKIGPSAIEQDMAQTLTSASIAQLGFWVPMTIVTGSLVGSLFAHRSAAAKHPT